MAEFLLGAAAFVLAMVALGLVRVLRGPADADRMMAAQLLGTGGIAAVLLLGAATGESAAVDVALTLALLAAFASFAFVKAQPGAAGDRSAAEDEPMSLVLDLWTVVAVVAGAFFFLAGTVGLLRFPDSFTRLHALTKADNLGLGLVVLGLLPQVDSVRAGLKLVCIWLLVLLSGATAAQLIARTLHARRPAPMIDVLNIGLAALILGLAVWTIVAREAFAAVVGFIAYGLLLTLAWVQLHGIDVALTEAAIGGGLTGALLIGAAARLRGTEAAARAERPGHRDALAGRGRVGAPSPWRSRSACSRCPSPRPRWRPTSLPTSPSPRSATRSPPCCWRFARWTRCSRRSCCCSR